jgi:uncharacterized protein YbbK (DUF523 family)
MDSKQKTIAVSACLLGINCKYNGGNNRNERVIAFLEGKKVIPVCPETAAGLPSPRPPVEIRNGKVINEAGEDRDALYRKGARAVWDEIKDKGISLAVLKAHSPTCGVHAVYDGTFSHTLVKGSGVFAALLKSKGIPVIDEDDIAHLDEKKKENQHADRRH